MRKPYFPTLRSIFDENTSIICNNCFGGRISQDLGYPYNSPTVGLYFFYPDYIRFLKNCRSIYNPPYIFEKNPSMFKGVKT